MMDAKFRVLAATILLSLVFTTTEAMAKVIGKFSVAKGKVTIKMANGKTKRARFGMKVSLGDAVVTKDKARAKVVMLDKNVIHISPNTEMKFENYDITDAPVQSNIIGVAYGKIRSNVKQKYDGKKKKFQVRTKAAVAGVRGTDWISSYSRKTKTAEFVTIKGEVEVGLLNINGKLIKTVWVRAGQKTKAVDGKAPWKPQKVSKKEMNKWKKESDAGDDKKEDGKKGGDKKNQKKDKDKKEAKKDGDKSDNKGGDKKGSKSGGKKSAWAPGKEGPSDDPLSGEGSGDLNDFEPKFPEVDNGPVVKAVPDEAKKVLEDTLTGDANVDIDINLPE